MQRLVPSIKLRQGDIAVLVPRQALSGYKCVRYELYQCARQIWHGKVVVRRCAATAGLTNRTFTKTRERPIVAAAATRLGGSAAITARSLPHRYAGNYHHKQAKQ